MVDMIQSVQGPPQDTAVVASSTKKRRADGADSSKNQKRGKPGELCRLNLDVLFLIAAYIHPLDLLNLARTCKSLRELLMDKASAFVWRAARCHVKGLPDCPADLTEPEYANLVFCARCHGCGKHATKVLWTMRRRYCSDCRDTRLCRLSSCPDLVRQNNALATEQLTKDHEITMWVDKEQLDLFILEYNHSSDKQRFWGEKRNQCSAIHRHAIKFKKWEKVVALQHRSDLESRRQERAQMIFERLKQHGYEPELAYFGPDAIQQAKMSFFKTCKPLTDKEWTQMWPEWSGTMAIFGSQRLDQTVYQPRRDVLARAYDDYVTFPSRNAPIYDLLPHVIEFSCLPPFLDVIYAPEGTQIGVKSFEFSFAQLPALVDEWRKQADAELADLIKVPSQLSSQAASGGRDVASGATPVESPIGKLLLACAVFDTSGTLAHHPDVFSTMLHYVDLMGGRREWERAIPIQRRFCVRFLEEAPYIVHACGLDPHVATAEDMDRRNARLKCLLCKDSYVRSWRDALYHALHSHRKENASLSTSLRWQVVSDEHICAIQAAELSAKKDLSLTSTRCLLCRPRVGDSHPQNFMIDHLIDRHGVEKDAIKEDVHYMAVGIHESYPVQMVEKRGKMTFVVPI